MGCEIRQGSDGRVEEDAGRLSFSFSGYMHVEVSLNSRSYLPSLKKMHTHANKEKSWSPYIWVQPVILLLYTNLKQLFYSQWSSFILIHLNLEFDPISIMK